jgi:putative membrane protein
MRFFPHGPLMPWFGWLGFGLSALFWLALIGGLIWLVVAATRSPRNVMMAPPAAGTGPSGPPLSPIEILRIRFARGEIDAATFDQMVQRIRESEQNPQMNV